MHLNFISSIDQLAGPGYSLTSLSSGFLTVAFLLELIGKTGSALAAASDELTRAGIHLACPSVVYSQPLF